MRRGFTSCVFWLILTAGLINACIQYGICIAEEFNSGCPNDLLIQENANYDLYGNMISCEENRSNFWERNKEAILAAVAISVITTIIIEIVKTALSILKSKIKSSLKKIGTSPKFYNLCLKIRDEISKILETIKDDDIDIDKKYELLKYSLRNICGENGLVSQLEFSYYEDDNAKRSHFGDLMKKLSRLPDCDSRKKLENLKSKINKLRQEKQRYTNNLDVPLNIANELSNAYEQYQKLVEERLQKIKKLVLEIKDKIIEP